MPQHYTVPTKNAFAALDDDSDNEDAILSKPEEVPVAEAPVAPKTTPTRPQRGSEEGARRGPRPDGQTRRPAQGDRPPRRARDETGDSPAAAESENRAIRAPRGRSGPRTNRNVRDGRDGQREFDRHSGTGRGREMKKQGGGGHNWGNDITDFGAENATEQPTPAPGAEIARESSFAEGESPAAPAAPEEPKTLSLDAYRANREKERAALPQAKEAEAADEDKQKLLQDGYQIYTKEQAPAPAHANRATDEEGSEEDSRKPRTMHLAEVTGVNMFRGRRGGRGGREGNGAPANQSARPQKSASTVKEINLSDQQAFPTLQAH